REEKEFYLTAAAREVAAAVIGELRERCLHSSKGAQLGDYYDAEAVLRCQVCDLPSDWRFWPLFQTSRGKRLRSLAARQRVQRRRSTLGWPEPRQFDCLRATYEARVRETLRQALAGPGTGKPIRAAGAKS